MRSISRMLNEEIQRAIERANLACAAASKGHVDQAIRDLQSLLQEIPDMVGARRNLALLLLRKGNADEALEELKLCIRDKPDFAAAWDTVGTTLLKTARPVAAFDAYTRALEIDPALLEVHSNRFLSTLYRLNQEAAQSKASREWRESFSLLEESQSEFQRVSLLDGEPMRIGFISPDFKLHSVAFFLMPVLREWKKRSVEIYLYSDVEAPDSITAKFGAMADHFSSVSGSSDRAVLEEIRKDRLHVLFDLCGHFQLNRQGVFAQRAASFQISWLGYPVSTHTPNIDFRVTDPILWVEHSPEREAEGRPLFVDSGIHCYEPILDCPSIQSAPVQRNGYFTFGCFNNALKISPEIAGLWGALLAKNPTARLLLKASAFSSAIVRDEIEKWIHPNSDVQVRIEFLERTDSLTDHLDSYNRVDLALDTYPYHGTTTTCESLWMGVPVITLQGALEQSRVGGSLLKQAGLGAFVADAPNAYVGLASALASDPSALLRYRSALRTHLSSGSLMDPSVLVSSLDQKIRELFIG